MSNRGKYMFINKTADNRNNICGKKITEYRKEQKISQRQLADNLQLIGLDVDKNAIQRIESGKRFVTDIEIVAISKVLNKSFDELLTKKI
jgi:transcriptional regulator with XRE-family HTH domain